MASFAPPPAALAETRSSPRIVRSCPAEFKVSLACCAASSHPLENLEPGFSWDRMVELAEHHGVIPQVYQHLSQAPAVPQATLAALRANYQHNAWRTMWLTRELLRVADTLATCGIQILPHKGPVLAEMLYGNVTSRQFSDLDMFVRVDDVRVVKELLCDLGYHGSLQLSRKQEDAYLRSGYEYTFDSAQGHNLLELQWQVLPRFYAVDFGMEGLFARAVNVSMAGAMVKTLSPEDLMLALCVHAAKHAWVRLSWLCDIARLTEQSLNWKFIHEEADRLGVRRIVSVTLWLASEFLGVVEPTAWTPDPEAQTIGQRVCQFIIGKTGLDPESLPYFKLMMHIRERASDRVRLLSRLLFTPSVGEWQSLRLPDNLFPLYRAVRLARVARRLVS